jgi:hypothetical protein
MKQWVFDWVIVPAMLGFIVGYALSPFWWVK